MVQSVKIIHFDENGWHLKTYVKYAKNTFLEIIKNIKINYVLM